MRLLLSLSALFLLCVGVLLIAEQPAYAYADPGTGLLAIQALGSAMVAAGWFLRRKITALFHRGGVTEVEPEANREEGTHLP